MNSRVKGTPDVLASPRDAQREVAFRGAADTFELRRDQNALAGLLASEQELHTAVLALVRSIAEDHWR